MSANAVTPFEESAEGYYETLTERLSSGRLAAVEALNYATEIATCLRDLHMQNLVYGAVSSQLILLNAEGATLRNSGSIARFGDRVSDEQAFGLVLNEMLRKADGPEGLCAQLNALAVRCQDGTMGMQQVVIRLRLLGLKARQGKVRARLLPVPRRSGHRGTVKLRFALSWKPLVNLLASAFSGK